MVSSHTFFFLPMLSLSLHAHNHHIIPCHTIPYQVVFGRVLSYCPRSFNNGFFVSKARALHLDLLFFYASLFFPSFPSHSLSLKPQDSQRVAHAMAKI
ncbi:MAG: hypothetical protein J3Q66DRAFT_347914 [Benniella sp.]|nr:MAG: hypothetical protein J3Q66DRAFT_347914 [Benniella sp.]